MIKKFLLIIAFLIPISAFSAGLDTFKVKNLKDNTKISVSESGDIWNVKFNKKENMYFIKKGTDFYTPNNNYSFTIESPYIFIHNNSLIAYCENDLMFYEYFYKDGKLINRELLIDEIGEIFSDFTIIRLSDFSNITNSLKIQKGSSDLKIMIFNDVVSDYSNYKFESNNAKFNLYPTSNAIKITHPGMIYFHNEYGNHKDYPWYILLIRK